MEVVKGDYARVMISNLSFHMIFNKYKYFYYSTASKALVFCPKPVM